MNAKLAIMTGLVFLSMVGISHAQATTPQTTKAVGTSGYDTVRMTGEEDAADGNLRSLQCAARPRVSH
jgi:hypothetical protein